MTELWSFLTRLVGWVIYLGSVTMLRPAFWNSSSLLRSPIPDVVVFNVDTMDCNLVTCFLFVDMKGEGVCLLDCFGCGGLVKGKVRVPEFIVGIKEHIPILIP